jgi:hypothetical protein
MKKIQLNPKVAIKTPPTAGPTMRMVGWAIPFSARALPKSRNGTVLGTMVCLTGWTIE